MRGARAKSLRRIAAKQEAQKNKHGQVMYYFNEKSGAIQAGGFRGVYKVFKRAFKKLRREDYDQDVVTKIT